MHEKTPDPIDVHVGGRIRDLRRQLGLNQKGLAKALGLSYQQVQKYERGANRISASKLFEMAKTLGVQIDDFYDGLTAGAAPGIAEGAPAAFVHDVPIAPEGQEIASVLARLPKKQRRLLLDLAKAMAGAGDGEAM